MQVTVAQVIYAVQGPLDIVTQVTKSEQNMSPVDNVLAGIFGQVEQLVDQVFTCLTLQELIDRQDELQDNQIASYTI